MNFDYLFKKEKLSWGKRRVTILGFKFTYVSKIKHQYECLIDSLELFKSLTDITTLKKANGKLRDHQLNLLKFTKEISDLLQQNQINPFLIAGSLVGVLRHKGFVPWDDDVDFAVLRDEYNQLIQLFKNNFKLIDNSRINLTKRTKYLEVLNQELMANPNKIIAVRYFTHFKVLRGTSIKDFQAIDLFPLEYINENISIEDYAREAKKINKLVRSIKMVDKAIFALEQLQIKSGLFSATPTSRVYYGFDNLDATKRTHKKFYETSLIYPLRQAEFENENFLVPNHSDLFMKIMLNGDYKQYPDDVGLSAHLQEYKNLSF